MELKMELKMKIHHIGYLVKDIRKAWEEFIKLAYVPVMPVVLGEDGEAAENQGYEVFDPARVADICFLEKDGYCIELVSPRDKTSVAYSLLKKHQNSPYHICYQCEDFDVQLELLAANGYTLISEPLAAPALGNRRVAFLMNYALGMIEVLEQA